MPLHRMTFRHVDAESGNHTPVHEISYVVDTDNLPECEKIIRQEAGLQEDMYRVMTAPYAAPLPALPELPGPGIPDFVIRATGEAADALAGRFGSGTVIVLAAVDAGEGHSYPAHAYRGSPIAVRGLAEWGHEAIRAHIQDSMGAVVRRTTPAPTVPVGRSVVQDTQR